MPATRVPESQVRYLAQKRPHSLMLPKLVMALKQSSKSYWVAVYLFPYLLIRRACLMKLRSVCRHKAGFEWLTFRIYGTKIRCVTPAMKFLSVAWTILMMVKPIWPNFVPFITFCRVKSVILSWNNDLFIGKMQPHQPNVCLLHLLSISVPVSMKLYIYMEIGTLDKCA